jgi:CDP-glucose 4,6-dehydratase
MEELVTAHFSDVLRGRRVLVTGHTGFKGSWLTIWLHHVGAHVVGYSLSPPTVPNNYEASRVGELLVENHEADVRDFSALFEAFQTAQPDVVFHLAAQSLVLDGYNQPLTTTTTNAMGTVNLLEAIRRTRRPCTVIVVTSDKCYENTGKISGYRESDRLGGDDPYSASKAAAEIFTASYRASFFDPDRIRHHGVKLATVRAGNVVGGGDWSENRIIPDAVRALEDHRPAPVRNPDSIRPWQHVVEPLGGYLKLAASMLATGDPALCTSWNFGPVASDERSVRELVEGFLAGWGTGTWEHTGDPDAPRESTVLRLDIEHAAAALDWRPVWDLSETVRRTARWYRRFAEDPDRSMREECLTDIAEYRIAQAH